MEEFDKDELEKSMNNAGLGGPGSVKAGAVLPSINRLPKPGNNSLAGKMKIPNVAPKSTKDPIKSAQQTQNKDIKDIRMKEAQNQFGEKLTIKKNGQWNLETIEKSDEDDKPVQEAKPAHAGTFHGQTHERVTERGHRLVKFPKQNPDGSDGFGVRKIPNKVKVVHTWDHDKKEWNHKETTNLVNSEKTSGDTSTVKSPMDIAREKAEAASKGAPQGESKVKTIRRKLEQVKKAIEDMEKSGYKGYTETDNARRKANNLSDETGIKSMNRVKAWGGSGIDAASREANEMKRKSKKNPVKVYTREEIAALQSKKD